MTITKKQAQDALQHAAIGMGESTYRILREFINGAPEAGGVLTPVACEHIETRPDKSQWCSRSLAYPRCTDCLDIAKPVARPTPAAAAGVPTEQVARTALGWQQRCEIAERNWRKCRQWAVAGGAPVEKLGDNPDTPWHEIRDAASPVAPAGAPTEERLHAAFAEQFPDLDAAIQLADNNPVHKIEGLTARHYRRYFMAGARALLSAGSQGEQQPHGAFDSHGEWKDRP